MTKFEKNVSIAFLFVTNLINVGSIFDERTKQHSTPVHIQTHDFGNRMERFLLDFYSIL